MKIFRPTKAVLLAAGFGTRLLPLTREVPKPLLPLWGRTLLDRALDVLAGFGVREVLINLHHGADAIRAHLAKNPRTDLRVQFSFEPEILGTGGALVRAQNFLPEAGPFWLFNADVVASLDPQPLLDDFARHQPLATLWLEPRLGPRTVEMQDGRILNLTSPLAGRSGLFTFTGLHLLTKRILEFLPQQEKFAGMTPTYTAAMACGEAVRGVTVADAHWMDLGTPVDYLAAHNVAMELYQLQRRGGEHFDPAVARRATLSDAQVKGFAALAEGISVPASAALWHCVVLPGARIAPDVKLQGAVIGPDTVVSCDVAGLVGRAERWLDAAELKAVRKVGFVPEETTVAAGEARGSQRTFARLISGDRTAILMRYDPEREENKLFARHARFLKKVGVPVPEVLFDDPRQHLTIVEDAGEHDLLDLQQGLTPKRRLELYETVLRMVMLLHAEGSELAIRTRLRHMPDFSTDLYRWERDYFAEYMLSRRCNVPKHRITRIKQELARVAQHIDWVPQALIHRDLQSSNILWKAKRLYMIDFQGMRFGPAAYDLASLLCDPYVDLPEDAQVHLLAYYKSKVGCEMHVDIFWWAAIQRLVQALGAFAKLSARPETEDFADHIPAALRQLKRAIGHNPFLPELGAWVDGAMRENP
ncbi:MAG: phosphotransferase [Kiritimatiellaeota bacterium]|nr:phosphotransferase [Kiritimatiellota bacterium]